MQSAELYSGEKRNALRLFTTGIWVASKAIKLHTHPGVAARRTRISLIALATLNWSISCENAENRLNFQNFAFASGKN